MSKLFCGLSIVLFSFSSLLSVLFRVYSILGFERSVHFLCRLYALILFLFFLSCASSLSSCSNGRFCFHARFAGNNPLAGDASEYSLASMNMLELCTWL